MNVVEKAAESRARPNFGGLDNICIKSPVWFQKNSFENKPAASAKRNMFTMQMMPPERSSHDEVVLHPYVLRFIWLRIIL